MNKVNLDISGVYKIINTVNGKYYVGSAINIRLRWNGHKSQLNRGVHHSQKLQRAWNKYGSGAFEFIVINVCSVEEMFDIEQSYIDIGFKKENKKLIYNIADSAYFTAGTKHFMFGKTHTEKSKKLIRLARSKQIIKHSNETKNKIRAANKGKTPDISSIKKGSNTKLLRFASGEIEAWNKGKNKYNDKRLKTISDNTKMILPIEMTNKIIQLYVNEKRSIEFIRKHFNLDWGVIKNNLIAHGIVTRNISQQKIIRDEQSSRRVG